MPFSELITKICCVFPKQGYKILPVADNGNGSPQTTPKAMRRYGIGPSPSIFYNDPPAVPARSSVLSSSSNNNNHADVDRLEEQRRLIKAIEEFKRNHERFRNVVMPDIIAYRERRNKPLIQF